MIDAKEARQKCLNCVSKHIDIISNDIVSASMNGKRSISIVINVNIDQASIIYEELILRNFKVSYEPKNRVNRGYLFEIKW